MKVSRLWRVLRKLNPVHSALQKAESDQQIVTIDWEGPCRHLIHCEKLKVINKLWDNFNIELLIIEFIFRIKSSEQNYGNMIPGMKIKSAVFREQ